MMTQCKTRNFKYAEFSFEWNFSSMLAVSYCNVYLRSYKVKYDWGIDTIAIRTIDNNYVISYWSFSSAGIDDSDESFEDTIKTFTFTSEEERNSIFQSAIRWVESYIMSNLGACKILTRVLNNWSTFDIFLEDSRISETNLKEMIYEVSKNLDNDYV